MSTVAPPASPARIEEAHHRIRHPLARLRKYINTYVFFEALGLIGLVLALAFWAGFWADYGVFKLFGFDWVQSDTAPLLVMLAVLAVLGGLTAAVWLAISAFQKSVVWGLVVLALLAVTVAFLPCGLSLIAFAAADWRKARWPFLLGLASGIVLMLSVMGISSNAALGIGSWGFRFLVLTSFVTFMIALVVFVVSTRFFKEFRDSALAMVLEKRFPKELGGRVITAVELHNPREAAKYGYSPALVAQTIQEAADRVETVPVADVFAWKRLYTYGFVLIYLTIGTYLLTAAGFCANRAAQNRHITREARERGTEPVGIHPAVTGFNDFHDVALIWAERNLLLRNVIWPRSAHLDLIPLDPREKSEPGYEPRIARDQTPPTLRAVAWKFVKTDRNRPEGLRQVTWQDLRDDPSLASGKAVPELVARWTPRDADAGLTVDEVELRLDAFTVRKDNLPTGEKLPATYCTVEPDGKTWRALTWGDLTQEKLGGLPVRPLPPEWDPTARAVGMLGMGGVGGFEALTRGAITTKLESLTIDDIQKVAAAAEKEADDELNKVGLDPAAAEKARSRKALLTDVRKAIDFLDHLAVLRETLDGVETRANQRGMRRNLRKLEVPTTATLYYYGRKTSSRVSMNRVADNEFTGTFADLKETVSYYAAGADYVTPVRRLIVVELPRLDKLESEEERPGYLYYRPSDPWKPSEMRGKRQRFEPIGVSLSGEASTIEVPMSTSLTLHGLSSKPLKGVTIVEFEKLKALLAPLRQAFAALLAAEEKQQEKRKAEPWVPAAARLLKTFGKDEKEHEVTTLVKALSSTDGGNDLEAVASVLAAGGEQGKQFAELFDQARNDDKTLVDAVADLSALGRLIKDVRDLVKNRVLDHLSLPKLAGTGEKTFTLAVADLRREQKFTLEFEDTDDVKGRRVVLIQPREDVAPRIREFNPDDVVRKGKEGFLVTASARIPFKGRVRDDHGLARVRFACKVTPADFLSDQKYLALNGVGAILPLCRPESRMMGMMFLALVNRSVANSAVEEAGEEQLVDLPVFQMQLEANKLRDGRSELLAPETVKGLLAAQQREPYRRLMGDFTLSPDKWTDNDEEANEPRQWVKAQDPRAPLFFDLPLWALKYNGEPLKESAADKPQKRYLVEVRLLADDTYTEGAEFIPAVVFDPRRDEERARFKKAVDVLRPYVTAARPAKRAENGAPSPLASLSQVLGEKAGTVDLATIGKGLVTPEADAMLAAAEAAVAGNEKGLQAIAEIRALTKEREPLPHTSPSSETFSFLVIPEFELMSRIGEEEEAKQKDLLKMMKPIRDGRDRMADAVVALSGNTNEQILNSVLARCDTVDDALKTAHADAISVRNAYDRIVREQRLNQMEHNVTAKMFREVALPLGKVVDVQFERALNAVKTLRRAVDSKDGTVAARANDSRPKAAEAQKQLDILFNELNDVIAKMKGITELKEILLLLEDVYNQEVKLHELAQMAHKALLRRLLDEGNKNP